MIPTATPSDRTIGSDRSLRWLCCASFRFPVAACAAATAGESGPSRLGRSGHMALEPQPHTAGRTTGRGRTRVNERGHARNWTADYSPTQPITVSPNITVNSTTNTMNNLAQLAIGMFIVVILAVSSRCSEPDRPSPTEALAVYCIGT